MRARGTPLLGRLGARTDAPNGAALPPVRFAHFPPRGKRHRSAELVDFLPPFRHLCRSLASQGGILRLVRCRQMYSMGFFAPTALPREKKSKKARKRSHRPKTGLRKAHRGLNQREDRDRQSPKSLSIALTFPCPEVAKLHTSVESPSGRFDAREENAY